MEIINLIVNPKMLPISQSIALPNNLNKGAVSPQNIANAASIKHHIHTIIATIANIVYPFKCFRIVLLINCSKI